MFFWVDIATSRLAILAIAGMSLQGGLTATQLAFWALPAGLSQHVVRRFWRARLRAAIGGAGAWPG